MMAFLRWALRVCPWRRRKSQEGGSTLSAAAKAKLDALEYVLSLPPAPDGSKCSACSKKGLVSWYEKQILCGRCLWLITRDDEQGEAS